MKTSERRLLAIAAWLFLFPLIVLAAPPELDAAQSLLNQGKAAEAYELLEPLEIKYAGDLAYDYLLATAALNAGHPSKATFIYERMLALEPDYVGVRADMGRAYYMMGDLARAKIEFESVLAFSNLPPDLRSAVDQYMAAIEQRSKQQATVVTGFFEVGVGSDSNALSATSSSIINYANGAQAILGPESRKRGNSYFSYAAGAELNHAFADQPWSAYLGGDYRARSHASLDTADNYTMDARAGVQHASGRSLVRGGVTFGRYWLDNAPTRDSYGATADWRFVIDDSDLLSVNGTATRLLYLAAAQRVNDYDLFAASLGWTHAIAATTSATLALSAGEENATGGRLDGDKSHWGLRGTLQHSFTDTLGAYVTAGYQPGRYKKINTDFDLVRRDELSDLTAGLVWSLQDRWSVSTTVSMSKNRSNMPINAYSRTDAAVVLRKDF